MKSIRKAVEYFGGNAEMAKALGVRADYVYKMAHGLRFPSLKRAIAIEKAAKRHVTAEEILNEKLELIRNMNVEKTKKSRIDGNDQILNADT